MSDTWFVQYWELDKPEVIHEDAFVSYEEAKAFYEEIMGNSTWDACILSDDDKAKLV